MIHLSICRPGGKPLAVASSQVLCYFEADGGSGSTGKRGNPLSKIKENSPMQSRGLVLLLIFFLFILILAFIFGDRGIVEIVKTQKQILALQQTIKTLEMEKQKLSREIELLKENPLALEKKAREDLWLMKKNEKVIVLVKDKTEAKHE
jgi:cell division protein FtsB